MEVALTGSTGFVGRRIVEKLLEAEHTVRCLVRPTSTTSAIERPGVSFVIGDLDDRDSLEMLVEGADAVVHNAVWRDSSLLQIGSEQPMRHFETNVMGSLALLELARLHTRQYIFISSGAVFGDPPGNEPLTEDHFRAPTTNYGAYKAAIECVCQAYAPQFHFNTCTLRPFSIIGLHEPPEASPFFNLVERVVNGERVDATRGQKYVMVDDVASAVAFALAHSDAVKGQIYNLCDGFVHQQDIAGIARKISGANAEIVPSERKPPRHEAPSEKIRALGFKFGGTPALRAYVEQLVRSILRS